MNSLPTWLAICGAALICLGAAWLFLRRRHVGLAALLKRFRRRHGTRSMPVPRDSLDKDWPHNVDAHYDEDGSRSGFAKGAAIANVISGGPGIKFVFGAAASVRATGDNIRLKANEYRVWFGTNRKPADRSDPSRGFSSARDKATHYGHCDVFVPESHKIGSVGSSWVKRLLTRTDDRLKPRRLGLLDRDDYWQALGRQLAQQAPGQRHAVVFIHGYNVSFEQAAIRAAQIGFDLGVGGAMAFFSWPSRGKTGQYIADGAAIEASEAAIADFLADFGRRSGADLVHVIAHSMGNRGLLRAINRIFADAERRSGCRFGEFILAAPDVDADTFGQLAGAYREMAARTTLYVSGRDRAVALSKWIHDYPRVGFEPPLSIFDGIDTISVTNVDLSMLGHGYVAEARPVLTDMHAIIFRGEPPEKRAFLKERKTDQGQRYWEVRG